MPRDGVKTRPTSADATRDIKASEEKGSKMKREEVKSKIPGITDELLDWLLNENGKDVSAANTRATTLQNQLDGVKAQLKTAQDGLKAFEGVDVKDLQGQITKLQQDLKDQADAHQKELAEKDFTTLLDGAITAKKGRSAKAIKAMLDIDALKASKNQESDITAALDKLAKESGYLFETEQTPPPYAAGTGTNPPPAGGDLASKIWAAAGVAPKTT